MIASILRRSIGSWICFGETGGWGGEAVASPAAPSVSPNSIRHFIVFLPFRGP